MTFTHILHRIVSSLTQSYSYVQTVTTIQINDLIQRKGAVVGRCHILQNVTIVTPGYCGSNKLYRKYSLEVVVINLGLRKTIVKRPKTVHLESVETNNSSPHTPTHVCVKDRLGFSINKANNVWRDSSSSCIAAITIESCKNIHRLL